MSTSTIPQIGSLRLTARGTVALELLSCWMSCLLRRSSGRAYPILPSNVMKLRSGPGGCCSIFWTRYKMPVLLETRPRLGVKKVLSCSAVSAGSLDEKSRSLVLRFGCQTKSRALPPLNASTWLRVRESATAGLAQKINRRVDRELPARAELRGELRRPIQLA